MFVSFTIRRNGGVPDLSKSLGIEPSMQSGHGDSTLAHRSEINEGYREPHVWHMDSPLSPDEIDENLHLKALLDLLVPKAAIIAPLAASSEIFFSIELESSRAFVGRGPQVHSRALLDIAKLGASLVCTVFCTDFHQTDISDPGLRTQPRTEGEIADR